MIDGYFINPEGNLGHQVASHHTQIHLYAYTPHRHTYINHIYIHIGRTYSQGVGVQIQEWVRPYGTVCNDCDSVDVDAQEESVLVLHVWIVQKDSVLVL